MSGHDLGARTYLGDGLFVESDGYHVTLATSDGSRDTNVVHLDPRVLREFQAWLARRYSAGEASNG